MFYIGFGLDVLDLVPNVPAEGLDMIWKMELIISLNSELAKVDDIVVLLTSVDMALPNGCIVPVDCG
jgi:hypothetical protein